MQFETIRRELIDIIREHEDRYWTGYAIWAHLKQRFPQAAAEISQSSSDASNGSDANRGPVSFITQSLSHAPNLVDQQWVYTQGISVNGREIAGERVAVFRWCGEFDRTF